MMYMVVVGTSVNMLLKLPTFRSIFLGPLPNKIILIGECYYVMGDSLAQIGIPNKKELVFVETDVQTSNTIINFFRVIRVEWVLTLHHHVNYGVVSIMTLDSNHGPTCLSKHCQPHRIKT